MSQGGEKTEQPTEKRLREARRKGQVTKSQDLTSALLLIVAVAVLWIAVGHMERRLSDAMREGIVGAASFKGELDTAFALHAINSNVVAMAWALAPLFVVMFVAALFVGYLQVGSIFAFESVKPNLNKLNPAENFKQKFLKQRPYIELAKTLLKISITALIVVVTLRAARAEIVQLTLQDIPHVGSFTLRIIFGIGLKVALAFLALGVGDYFLQRFLYLKELKMSKQEVKEEYKESEGDPLIKGMRRELHREILMQDMLEAIKGADAVLVNPTHVAVALRYERASMSAPTVVAKGAELMAAKIRETAKEAGVPIMRDVPLARALFELDINREIPEELYEPVATVLRWVYQLAAERGEVANHGRR